MTKLLTRWLPVGHNLNKYSKVHHSCPYCDQTETVYHLFQCPYNPKGTTNILENLDKQLLKLDTAPSLHFEIMLEFTEGLTLAASPEDSTPNWYLACAGLLPSEWTKSQALFQETQKKHPQPPEGEKWTQQLSYWLVQHSNKVWTSRNNHLHQHQDTSTAKTRQLHRHVSALYSQKSNLLPPDQKMFHLPLEQRLNQPMHTLKQWFTQTYITTQHCLHQSKTLLQQGQKDIHQYFQPSKTTENLQ